MLKMIFFKQAKLYRIEIITSCDNKNIYEKKLNFNYTPMYFGGYRKFNNIIPVGITGWIIQWFGKKYFVVDDNQPSLEEFQTIKEDSVLIPYKRIEGNYKVIE